VRLIAVSEILCSLGLYRKRRGLVASGIFTVSCRLRAIRLFCLVAKLYTAWSFVVCSRFRSPGLFTFSSQFLSDGILDFDTWLYDTWLVSVFEIVSSIGLVDFDLWGIWDRGCPASRVLFLGELLLTNGRDPVSFWGEQTGLFAVFAGLLFSRFVGVSPKLCTVRLVNVSI